MPRERQRPRSGPCRWRARGWRGQARSAAFLTQRVAPHQQQRAERRRDDQEADRQGRRVPHALGHEGGFIDVQREQFGGEPRAAIRHGVNDFEAAQGVDHPHQDRDHQEGNQPDYYNKRHYRKNQLLAG